MYGLRLQAMVCANKTEGKVFLLYGQTKGGIKKKEAVNLP